MAKSIADLQQTLRHTRYMDTLETSRQALETMLAEDLATLENGKPPQHRVSPLDATLKADVQPHRPKYAAFMSLREEIRAASQDKSLSSEFMTKMDTTLRAALKEAMFEYHAIFQQYRAIMIPINKPAPKKGPWFSRLMFADEEIYQQLNDVSPSSQDRILDLLWAHMETRPEALHETLRAYDTYVTTGSLAEVPLDKLTDTMLLAILKLLLLRDDKDLSKAMYSHIDQMRNHMFALSFTLSHDMSRTEDIAAAIEALKGSKNDCMLAMGKFLDKRDNESKIGLENAWKKYLLELNAVYTKIIAYAALQVQMLTLGDTDDCVFRKAIRQMFDEKTSVYKALQILEPRKFSESDHEKFMDYFQKTYPTLDDAMAQPLMGMTVMYDFLKNLPALAAGPSTPKITDGRPTPGAREQAVEMLKEKYKMKPLAPDDYDTFKKTLQCYDTFLETGSPGDCALFRSRWSRFFTS